MNTTLLTYNQITRDFDRSIDVLSQRADVEREVEYYRANIENVDSPDQLVSDQRLFAFAMRAHGLEDMTYAKAFMLKVLKEGRDDDSAFANTLTDPRYSAFAETFDFNRYGETATTFTRARQGVVDDYLVQSMEMEVGQSDAGARLALYFRRNAGEVESYFGILADKALAEVTRTALGLPDAIASLDLNRQAAMIAEKLPLDDLRDPQKVEEFIQRFAALWQIKSSGSNTISSPALTILGGQTAFSADLLFSIQKIVR